ncbi:phosphate ABC transporter permease PstA [Govanella unica]|uniref:Phosphate transport system permease protein PstA n=1 Tax=Govanella unica TaxID=2975056 RepID=A0A9X3TXX3_9PROT|nr:phosphate ABC transporter permease PstA [Govania unica]MDA5193614.1 phosphate ABC transporter permease PstA [Govania unica]
MSIVQDKTDNAIWDSPDMRNRIRRRYAAERRFKAMGLGAVLFAVAALLILLATILSKGLGGFTQTQVRLDIHFDPAVIGDPNAPDFKHLAEDADYAALVRDSLKKTFPEVTERRDLRALTSLMSAGARVELRKMVLDDPSLVGQTKPLWLLASADVDMYIKGSISGSGHENDRRVKDNAVSWIEALKKDHRIEARFNWHFFTFGDSREPEMAGIWGATVGSLLTLAVTLLIAFPVGVSAAIYLEEFAPQNRWTDVIEVNINNLAAVPSIVFGLLGLAVFLNTMGLPRSAPLVGGMTLALITLPTIIIASRAAIKAVPPSIRAAATGLGASKVQVVMHHVLPLAMPGILTGTIIGMAHALGETAPLLMIGMVAFIVDVPQGIMDPATVLPVQIYLWADSPERAFVEKTSAAILVLLMFLIFMNAIAIMLRQKFERRW